MGKNLMLLSLAVLYMSCQKSSMLQTESVSMHATVPSAPLVNYEVAPSVTDPNITTFNNKHYTSVIPGGDTMRPLLVFLAGTYHSPIEYKSILQLAAQIGYQAVGLSYANTTSVNTMCRPTGDTTCHYRARMENIDGTNRHSSVNVNWTNSIVNRLIKLLQHMAVTHPNTGWSQYYVNNRIQWTKIVIAGHSQGGSLAGIIGKSWPVKKVIMMSIMDYLDNGAIPSWVNSTANSHKYYALFHHKDELMPYNTVGIGWEKLGMYRYGHSVWIDLPGATPPYNNSHILIASHTPKPGIDPYHNGTAIDSYLLKDNAGNFTLEPAWRYLLRK